MSIHFHPLTVKEIRRETKDCVSVSFGVPVDKQKDFAFTQGQSLTMRAFINGEEARRTYSLCSSPLENEWRVAIKKVEKGLFSTYANELLKKGDVLEVMTPVGKFNCELDAANKKHYLAFAAGSGITPILSIIKTTLALEPQSEFTLVYGNKSRPSIIFFEELEGMKNKYMDRFNLVHILSRERMDAEINYGRIDKKKLKELNAALDFSGMDEFYICGPEEMIFCVKEFLEENDTDKKKIHFELFTAPGEAFKKLKLQAEETTTDGPTSHITIKVDGRSFEFEHPFNSEVTLLDAALQQGADLPYACKGGMCCTCKAKLLEGEVSMDVHWGLEDEEVENGYVLACQSHPRTEKVVVDFDR